MYKITEGIAVSLAIFGGFLLLLAATMVVASVAGREILSTPISGDFELMEILVAVSAFSFLPYLMWKKGNIAVTIITSGLPPQYKDMLDKTALGCFVLLYALLGYYGMIGALDAEADGIQSQILGLPIWPGMGYGSLCLGLSSLISLQHLISR